MAAKKCPQCGADNPAGSKFCDSCGIRLTQRLTVPLTSGHIAPPPTPTAPPSAFAATTGGGASVPASPVPAQPTAGGGGEIGKGALVPGATLSGGRYVIDKALGKGGMGSIFLAHDTRLDGKQVVIKEMLQTYASEAERIEAEEAFMGERSTLST